MADTTKYDFVVVANRLPVDRHYDKDGAIQWRTSPGGLVTAMEPVMKTHEGAWVGWSGAPDEELEPFDESNMHLVPVPLSQQEVNEYYEGFSNSTLWPLYHDAVEAPEFHREWWDAYVTVNQRFADRAAAVADDGATVWVQDYQLQLVPAMLRKVRPDLRIGFFLHIPFPPLELFQQLPWRRQICEGLLGADLVGFQLNGGAKNFVRTCRVRLGLRTHKDQINVTDQANVDDRVVEARAYPISIDAAGFAELANTPEVIARAEEIREDLGSPETLFVGIDRLDYTKGLRQRIRAFGELFSEGDLDPATSHFLQVATPSRERVEQYKRLRDDIELLVGRINGGIGRIGMPPISYLHASYPRTEMAALYRAADIMVVTPLRDGMNLVAKEYIACRDSDTGALVLSEFAGAAAELKQAYMVNPHDINGLKDVLLRTKDDTPQNHRKRMRAMRKQLFENDINHWADRFLSDLADEDD